MDRLNRVGPRHRDALHAIGIDTVLDLVTHYPRRYVDRTNQADIADLVEGQEAMVLGTVRRSSSRRTRQGRTLVEVVLFDGSSYLSLTFFNQPWRARQLSEGTQVVVFGKVERFRGRTRMTNPVVDLVGDRTGRIVPVYPQSEKAGRQQLGDRRLGGRGPAAGPDASSIRSRNRGGAGWSCPTATGPCTRSTPRTPWPTASAARRRLAFDELLRLQVILVMRKRAVERDAVGIRHQVDGELVGRFRNGLPFTLTAAQDRAIAEISADMAGPHPMHRLLQGDVGSGKTVVAVAALLTAVEGGHQGALMAPTEVLAEQHHAGVSALLEGLHPARASRRSCPTARCGWRCSPTAPRPGSGPGCTPAWPTAPSTS